MISHLDGHDGSGVKLNLGAGDDRRDGYVSVDLRPEVADVVCDVRKLEHWGDGEVDEILALDILEHFPGDQTNQILGEWVRVLRPGGTLTVRVPNLYRLAQTLVSRTDIGRGDAVQVLITNIYGGHRYGPDGSLDTHHWGFVPASLHHALGTCGLEVISDDGALNNTVKARKRA